MRGDRPPILGIDMILIPFTPHARGSTCFYRPFFARGNVYPACAGIDLYHYCSECLEDGLPRMRGDRPHRCPRSSGFGPFTPHARGSTPTRIAAKG